MLRRRRLQRTVRRLRRMGDGCGEWGRDGDGTHLKRLLARMLANVSAQDAGGSEGLCAVHALVRALAAVHASVLVEARRLRESLAARLALVRPVLFVDV